MLLLFFFSIRRRHTRCALVTGVQTCALPISEYTQAWTTFANVEKSWAYRQDQLPSTHPVAADIPDLHAVEVNFDGITYAKGASVLKQQNGRATCRERVRQYV